MRSGGGLPVRGPAQAATFFLPDFLWAFLFFSTRSAATRSDFLIFRAFLPSASSRTSWRLRTPYPAGRVPSLSMRMGQRSHRVAETQHFVFGSSTFFPIDPA